MFPKTLERVLACLGYLILLAAFFHQVVVGGRTFQTPAYHPISGVLPNETHNYPGPRLPLERQALKDPSSSAYNEELAPYLLHRYLPWTPPLWNPYVACGTPLAANPIYAAFAPLSLLVAAFPGPAAWDAFCLARLAVAGLGMVLLMYRLGAGGLGALLAAAAYALTGHCVGYANLVGMNVDMLLPWMLWAVDRLLAEPRRLSSGLLLGVVWGLAILGGNPEALLVGALASLFYFGWGIFFGVTRDEGETAPTGAPAPAEADPADSAKAFVAAAALAIGATLFCTLPFLEFFILAHHTHAPEMGTEHYAIYETIPLFSPFFYLKSYEIGRYFPPYFGATLLALACFAIDGLHARGRARLCFLAIAALVLTKTTGFGFINWIGRLPGLHYMIFTKYTAPLYLALAVLAGLGLDNLLRRRARPVFCLPQACGLAIGFFLLLWRNHSMLARFTPAVEAERMLNQLELAGCGVGVLLAVALGAAYGAARLERGATALSVALLLVALGEAWINFPRHWPLRHPYYDPPPYLETLVARAGETPDRFYGVDVALIPQLSVVYGLQDVRNLAVMNEGRYYRFMKTALTRPELWTGKDPYFDAMFTGSQAPHVLSSPLLDMLGARYILSDRYLGIPAFHEELLRDCQVVEGETSGVVRGYRLGYFYLGMSGPVTLRYALDVPLTGDVLELWPLIDGKEYDKLRGGVAYRVAIDDGATSPVVLAERTINPARLDAHQQLDRLAFDLGRWAGRRVALELRVSGDLETSAPVKLLWRDLYLRSREQTLSPFTPLVDDKVKLYENPRVMPRAWFAPAHRQIARSSDLLQEMLKESFDPRAEALIQTPLRKRDTAIFAQPSTATQSLAGSFAITRYGPHTVRIEGEAPQAGWVVLSDTYYPGWFAFVDGWPAGIYRANGFLRAVPVKAGKHTLVFRYLPWSFYGGLAVSALSLLLTIRFLLSIGRGGSRYASPIRYVSLR